MKELLILSVDDDGRINSGRKNLIRVLKSFAGKKIILTIERKFNKRSTLQNAYLHGVVFAMIRERLLELGHEQARSKSWVKQAMKEAFLKDSIVIEATGEVLDGVRDTSSLTTSEMMDFIADMQQWAIEALDLYIPDPNEQTEIFK